MSKDILLKTEFSDLKLFKRGKVRDVYDLDDKLLIVSTDRISCFDVVLPAGIPSKGKVLTALSVFWFNFTKDVIPNHLISAEVKDFPQQVQKYAQTLEGRSMLVKKSKAVPVECVVRGYLAGSGWKEYKKEQSVCGITLPPRLKEAQQLPQVIFTPATKEETGHDMNVTQQYIEDTIGKALADTLKMVSIAIYKKASEYACSRGIIISDTKFEFGQDGDKLILIDEILTPDSSRFWPQDQYQPGRSQPSFDKQYVRDYLETLDWDKKPPAPDLPSEVVEKTTQKYLQALTMITGSRG